MMEGFADEMGLGKTVEVIMPGWRIVERRALGRTRSARMSKRCDDDGCKSRER